MPRPDYLRQLTPSAINEMTNEEQKLAEQPKSEAKTEQQVIQSVAADKRATVEEPKIEKKKPTTQLSVVNKVKLQNQQRHFDKPQISNQSSGSKPSMIQTRGNYKVAKSPANVVEQESPKMTKSGDSVEEAAKCTIL